MKLISKIISSHFIDIKKQEKLDELIMDMNYGVTQSFNDHEKMREIAKEQVRRESKTEEWHRKEIKEQEIKKIVFLNIIFNFLFFIMIFFMKSLKKFYNFIKWNSMNISN